MRKEKPILALWSSSLVAKFPLNSCNSRDASSEHGPNFGPMLSKLYSFVQSASHFCFLDSKVLLSLVRAHTEAGTGHTSSDQLVDLEEGDRAETYHDGKEAVGK